MEERFVSGLSFGLAPTRAAGWAVGSASRLVREPHIRAALLAVHQNTGLVLDLLANREKSFDEVETST